MTSTFSRHAPLAGVLVVVLAAASFAVEGSTPGDDSPAAEIAEFYVSHQTRVAVGSMLTAVAGVLLIFFAAAVGRAIRRSEGDAGILAAVAFGGGIVAAAGITTDAALRFALSQAAEEIDSAGVHTLYSLWSGFFWPMHVGLAVLVLAASLAALDSRLVPLWLAWIGIVAAVIAIVGFFMALALIGLLTLTLWVLVASVMLWRAEVHGSAATS